ncbi:MAG: radical SAM/SPASM domain-containing protein [Fibrobacteres bacterium]|nr:radical SAM/SPASM domain-containing protein [Fibrobacterota bacterium]
MSVILGLSNICNLNCIYCPRESINAKYQNGYIEEAVYNKAIKFCKETGIRNICLLSAGETTLHPDWMNKVRTLITQGFAVNIPSNFAKQFTWEEAEVLAQCASLAVSIDTADPEVLLRLRKGLKLSNIAYNMSLIRAAAASLKVPCPPITWVGVVSNISIASNMKRFAHFAIGCKASGINLIPLQMSAELMESKDIDWITRQSVDVLRKFIGDLGECEQILLSSGLSFNVSPSLLEDVKNSILKRLGDPNTTREPEVLQLQGLNEVFSYAHTLKAIPGETRDCDTPWSTLMIPHTGEIIACCYMENVIGHLDDGRSAQEILNGKEAQELRTSLLEGNLRPVCTACPRGAITSPAAFIQKIGARLNVRFN